MPQPKTLVFTAFCNARTKKNTSIYSLTQCMDETTVNSDEFIHFHIPIPNAKIAKTLENTTFLLNDFLRKMQFLAFVLFFLRWIPPNSLTFAELVFFGFPHILAGPVAWAAPRLWLKPAENGLRHNTALPDRWARSMPRTPPCPAETEKKFFTSSDPHHDISKQPR